MTPDGNHDDRDRDHTGQSRPRGPGVPRDWPLGSYHLLGIGIDAYAHWNRLGTAKAGAEAVCAVLQAEFGFLPEHCRLLLNEEATGEAILAVLTLMAMTLPEEASLLIYFAGHGHIEDLTKLGWWIPVDGARPSTEEELRKGRVGTKTWISNAQIKAVLGAMKAKHVLLVSDSCYSGDFVRAMTEVTPATDEYVKAALLRTSRHALTSGGLHPVQDDGFHGQSVFTHFFLKALQDRTVPWYTAHLLHGRVADGVLANARQMPAVGVVREAGGELSGEFVLVRPAAVDVERRLEEGSAELKALEEALERDRVAREEAARRREAKEAELAALQERIDALRAAQGAGVGGAGNWERMKALLDSKKRQAEELRRLQQQQEEEQRRRAEELERLEQEEREGRRKRFESEWAQYEDYLQDPDIPKEHHGEMWIAICGEFGVHPKSTAPGKLRWNGVGVEEVVVMPKPAPTPPPGPSTNGRIGDVFQTEIGMDLLWIPAGTFQMGSPAGVGHGDERPQTEVTISRPFWMGKYPVRQRDWTAVMGSNPSHFKGEDLPVESVDWNQGVEFGRKLTERMKGKIPEGYEFRLPTEAEWEYACRAGTTTQWSFGDVESEMEKYGWFSGNSGGKTHPVGEKLPNPWGLYDMHGGVREWVHDWSGSYPGGRVTDSKGAANGSYRVNRGGSWNDSVGGCRSAFRDGHGPGRRGDNLGFRLVLAPRSVH